MRIFLSAAILASLSVAAPARAQLFNPLSVVTSAVEAAAEDRSASDIATDAKLKAKIVADLTDALGKDAISVTTDVYEQDVLLVGTLKSSAIKDKAASIARKTAGVRKVVDEMTVAKGGGKGAAEGLVDDTVVEKKLAAKIMAEKGVSHTNWRWHSVDGTVYLFGRSLSKAESAKVESLAKSTDNVVRVVDRAKVKPKK